MTSTQVANTPLRRMLEHKHTLKHKHEGEIKQGSRKMRKWACSDLSKIFNSHSETAEKILSQLIVTGSVNFGSSDSWENC